ncbi:response regulator [Puniceicoccaceae bacterium K14]|nr:response regulator [Puniceicoccaceae bacterium K14]
MTELCLSKNTHLFHNSLNPTLVSSHHSITTRHSRNSRKKHPLKRLLLSVVLLCNFGEIEGSTTTPIEEGLPKFEIYEQDKIGTHQNIGAITFDKLGRLIVGSEDILSVYDGQKWTNIHQSATETEKAIKFLSPSKDGKLLAVTEENIGHLSINEEGDYQLIPIGHQSLSNKLNASNAKGIYVLDDSLYIHSESILSSYDENGFATQWSPVGGLVAIFEFQGDLFVSSWSDGLMRATKGYFEYPKLGSQLARDMTVLDAVELNESTALFLTAGKGFFTYNGETILPFRLQGDQELERRIEDICKLDDRHIAAIVEGEGIIIFDTSGRILQRFDHKIDRRFNQASNLNSSNGALWATIGDAIIRIEYPSSYTYFSQILDVPLNNFSFTRHDNELWISSGDTLFDNDLVDKKFQYTPFPKDFGIPAGSVPINSHYALSSDYGLLVATDHDIILMDKRAPSIIARDTQAEFLLQLEKHPDTIIWANNSEIGMLQRNANTWQRSGQIIEIQQLDCHLTEDSNGNIWVELDAGRIGKLTINNNLLDLQILSQEYGLNEHSIQAWKSENSVYFSQHDVVWRYNERSNFFEEAYEITALLPENTKKIKRGTEDSFSNIWIPAASKNLILKPDGKNGYILDDKSSAKTNPFDIQEFHADVDGVVWAIGPNEVIRIDPKFGLATHKNWQTHIDKITLSDEQRIIYHSLSGNDLKKLTLPYEDNSLVFHLTTPTTAEAITIDHQAFLDGFSQNWTHIDQSNVFIIANLHEGDYTLRTRVLFGDEVINPIDAISFSIEPPFYRSPLSYIFYAVSFCGLVIFIGAKFSSAAQRENMRLQSIVGDRTNELRKTNDKLSETAKRAEAANRAKSVFLASMSHEIRTPLNGVIGMTSLLKQTELTSDQIELVNIIENSGENVVNIINDILDYSKIEAGKIELEYTTFSLIETVELAMDLFIEPVSKKNIEIAYLIQEDVPAIAIGDSSRIRQVLVNLIGNAIKFTDSGHIFVNVALAKITNDDAIVEFTVEDTGIGIPADKLDLLFRSFSQVDTNRDQQFGGTGLGLAISKRLVEIMGGEIKVESQESKGSQFVFKIPLKLEKDIPIAQPSEELRGKKIFIVQNSFLQRRILEHYSRVWGVEFESAASFKDALEIAHNTLEPFDVALIDLALPEINGEELATELSHLPAFHNTGFLAISNNSLDANGAFAMNIPKPIKPRFLFSCISKIVAQPKENQGSELGGEEKRLTEARASENDLNILLVDDNETNRKVGRMLLHKLGYSPTEVVNGQDAVNAVRSNRFDIILMDVQMPVMDGREATKQIRAANLDYKPWIVAVTAGAMRGDMNKAFEAGMDDFLSKPVLLETLRKTMERAQSAAINRSTRAKEIKSR